jgi:hypothetical protein
MKLAVTLHRMGVCMYRKNMVMQGRPKSPGPLHKQNFKTLLRQGFFIDFLKDGFDFIEITIDKINIKS